MNNYIKPTTTVIAVNIQQMIAASVEFGEGTKDGAGATAKGGMLWDDDEDYPQGGTSYNIWEE